MANDDESATLEDFQSNVRRLVRKLGHTQNSEKIYAELDAAVQACMRRLADTVRDVPSYERVNESNRRRLIKTPSQKVTDIKIELEELLAWFSTGRRPSKREVVSQYALAAMLGEAPFGRRVMAARRQVQSLPFVDEDGAPDTPAILVLEHEPRYTEILSSDWRVAEAQIYRFWLLRGPDGEPLATTFHKFVHSWPETFIAAVNNARQRSIPLLIDSLREALASGPVKDREKIEAEAHHQMRQGMLVTLGMMDHLFPVPKKSRITLTRWSQSDAIFGLVQTALDIVWPIGRGIPGTRRVSLTSDSAKSHLSDRELLQDLGQQLVCWVQRLVDDLKPGSAVKTDDEVNALVYARFGGDKSVIGTRDNQDKRVAETTSLVLSLRAEQLAYLLARETVVEICEAISSSTTDQILYAAAERVSAHVVTQIDKRRVARNRLLSFGYDQLEGDTLKWFGRFDVPNRFKWGGESSLLRLLLGRGNINHQALKHLNALAGDLHKHGRLDRDSVEAWRIVSDWAAGPGLDSWKPAKISD